MRHAASSQMSGWLVSEFSRVFDSCSKIESHDWTVLERLLCTPLRVWAGLDWSRPPRVWVHLLWGQRPHWGKDWGQDLQGIDLGSMHTLPARILLSFSKNEPDSDWWDQAGLLQYSWHWGIVCPWRTKWPGTHWTGGLGSQPPAGSLSPPGNTTLGSGCACIVGDRKRAVHQSCSVGLILEKGLLMEITDGSLGQLRHFWKEKWVK